MQPKNARDSLDFKVTETNVAGHGSYAPVDSGGITGDKITISSKDRSKNQRHPKTLVVGEATVSSQRARDSKYKHQAQRAEYSK